MFVLPKDECLPPCPIPLLHQPSASGSVLRAQTLTTHTSVNTEHRPPDPQDNSPTIFILDLLFTGEENEIQKVGHIPNVVHLMGTLGDVHRVRQGPGKYLENGTEVRSRNSGLPTAQLPCNNVGASRCGMEPRKTYSRIAIYIRFKNRSELGLFGNASVSGKTKDNARK